MHLLSRDERRSLNRKLRAGRKEGRAVELDRREFRVMFDQMTQRQLGMSADEFLQRMERGKLPDSEMAEYLAQMVGGKAAS